MQIEHRPLSGQDSWLFSEGTHARMHDTLGCHLRANGQGATFAVWAPNAQAISVYQQAFPGKQIIGIDGTQIVSSAGVFHCIVMHVPDPDWIFEDDFETADTSVWSAAVTPP